MNTRRDRERQQRREALLEAAARVFGRKPFFEATMQEVAAEAEIGMQGLYEHFPSKQDLYEQVMLHRAELFHRQFDAALAGAAGSPLDKIRVLADVYAEHFRERPFTLPTFIQDRVLHDWGFKSRFQPRLQEIYQRDRARLKALIQEALDQGLLRPMDPEYLTQLALQVLESSLYFSHRCLREEEARACVDRAVSCLLHGVGRP